MCIQFHPFQPFYSKLHSKRFKCISKISKKSNFTIYKPIFKPSPIGKQIVAVQMCSEVHSHSFGENVFDYHFDSRELFRDSV